MNTDDYEYDEFEDDDNDEKNYDEFEDDDDWF